ncbi:MAG: hypothetical protein P8X82_02805 [Gemmatimonadales bacterium]
MSRISSMLLAFPVMLVVACDAPGLDMEPVFVNGRAVAPLGDSLLAIILPEKPGVMLYDRRTNTGEILGDDALHSPAHLQWVDDRLYVSDIVDGRPRIVVLTVTGEVNRQIDLGPMAAAAHQFAVLPNGDIITETTDDRLLAVEGDSGSTFALVEASPRTGFLVAARGGVLHAVPDKSLTLYNGLGKIRWRVDWPWEESAFVADLAVDSHGRPLVLAGNEGTEGFVVFGLDPVTGEVSRWMEGPSSTFSISRYGEIQPDSASPWLGAG